MFEKSQSAPPSVFRVSYDMERQAVSGRQKQDVQPFGKSKEHAVGKPKKEGTTKDSKYTEVSKRRVLVREATE